MLGALQFVNSKVLTLRYRESAHNEEGEEEEEETEILERVRGEGGGEAEPEPRPGAWSRRCVAYGGTGSRACENRGWLERRERG